MISGSQIRAAPGWPDIDIIVAAIMAALAVQGAVTVVRQSLSELRNSRTTPASV
jgi:Co/Zn/Cd efflux system component